VGRTQAARATKYIEFHDGVRLPHVYLPAHSLHITERALQAAGCRKQVRLQGGEETPGEKATAAKCKYRVQLQISRQSQTEPKSALGQS
jgi:hypothetical protein